MVYSIHVVSFFSVNSRTTFRKSSCDTFFWLMTIAWAVTSNKQENSIIAHITYKYTYINNQWTFLTFLITCQRSHSYLVVFKSFCCIFQLLRSWNTKYISLQDTAQTYCVWDHPIQYMCTIQMQRCSNVMYLI